MEISICNWNKSPLPKSYKIKNKCAKEKNKDEWISQKSKDFAQKYYPNISLAEWDDWHWQIRNSITKIEDLTKFINCGDSNILQNICEIKLPLRITPYYASLLDKKSYRDPIVKTVLPSHQELNRSLGESNDPLGEENHSPISCLVHRYPDRVLFLVTNFCSTYCRYCTRSRIVGKREHNNNVSNWNMAFDYIKSNSNIRDVIISGGDPLTLPNNKIQYLLSNLRNIKHVEIIRIGSKVPVVLPQRINSTLINILKRYHPLWMNIHFTHPEELSPETNKACEMLANAGIPLGSQTVLLKDINNDVNTMRDLFLGLLKIRVRPYYIYQCDPIPGSMHFRTHVNDGLEIIKGIRGHISGLAIPHYVIDAPGGGGKIPLLPQYCQGKVDNQWILKNYKGNQYSYPDYDNI